MVRAAVVTVVLAAGLVAPAGASSAAGRTTPNLLTTSSPTPAVGQTVTLSGSVEGSTARRVALQRWTGRTWRTLDSTRTSRRGSFSFRHRADASVSLRAKAPSTTRAGKRLGARTSKTLRLRPVAQTASLTVSAAGARLTATASFRPAIAGRTVVFRRLVGSTWHVVARGTQSAGGRAAATFTVSAGTHQLRVETSGRSAPTARSTTTRVVVASAPPPVETPTTPTTTPTPTVPTPTVPTPEPTTPTPTVPTPTVPTSEPTVDPEPIEVLPRVDVTTSDGAPVTSKEVYSTATMTIDPRGSTLPAGAATSMRIRVRGNVTSWVSIKYPFKLKLDKKQGLLGMPASKNWALLANFFDRSMLRNQLAFEASRRVGLPWTPRTQPVELWVNGSYRGLYQLAENIEAETGRVQVPAGGHLLEADSYADEGTPSFLTPRGVQVFLKGDETDDERDVVAAQVKAFEDALYSDSFTGPDGWAAHADVDSFVDWYLVNELTKNIDSSINNSVWMVIDASGRLSMGPVWDFDFSAGNRRVWGVDDPTGWLVRRNWFDAADPMTVPSQVRGPEFGPAGHWYVRMFEDPAFQAQVQARWREVSGELSTLPAYVRSEAERVAPAAARNFAEGSAGTTLPIGPTFLEPEPDHVFTGSWDGEVDLLETWIGNRWAWMDQQLGG